MLKAKKELTVTMSGNDSHSGIAAAKAAFSSAADPIKMRGRPNTSKINPLVIEPTMQARPASVSSRDPWATSVLATRRRSRKAAPRCPIEKPCQK